MASTEETTVTLEANGRSATVPFSQFVEQQLTFDAGAYDGSPDFASLKISGDLPIGRDLKRRRQLTVRVATDDGELLCEATATVTAIAFKDKTDKYGTTTERVHTITLD